MFKSIQHFEGSGIKKIEKIIECFIKDPKDMASFVYGIRDEVIALGLDLIKETLEDCDQMLRGSEKRRQSWEVVRTDEKKLTTSLGTKNIVPEQTDQKKHVSAGSDPGDRKP